MAYFVVMNEQGPSWVDARPMREQELWNEHAAWVNSLVDAGFIVLGGPIGNGHPHRAMLILNSESDTAAFARLQTDPWVKAGILRTGRLEPWKILASSDKMDRVLGDVTGSATPH